jgi:hypothetical protein
MFNGYRTLHQEPQSVQPPLRIAAMTTFTGEWVQSRLCLKTDSVQVERALQGTKPVVLATGGHGGIRKPIGSGLRLDATDASICLVSVRVARAPFLAQSRAL